MKRVLMVVLGLGVAAGRAAAQTPVEYDVSFPDATHHLVRITMTVHDLEVGTPVNVVMPRSSPGRYAIHDFAKNVFDLVALGATGDTLPIRRITPSEWRVSGHDGTMALTYTVFGDHADGTYLGVDSTHAHFNMPAAFMFIRGEHASPIRVRFRPIHGWKVATQLRPTDEPNTFEAPDLQYLMDSPTELSDHDIREWKQDGETFRLALHHLGTAAEADRFAAMARTVVAEERAVFGELPAFDYGTYTFIADYLPWVHGDGMEHRNSTLISSTRPLSTSAMANLGTLAHEFFHAWNMERIRDRAIEPFDFERADMSGNLWLGEGFTSYYDGLVRTRAGFTSLDEYAASLGGALDAVINSPARAVHSPVQMSQMAPFVDAAVHIDEMDAANAFISYYTWGEVLGLGLDLTLRERFDSSLDAYMRALWTRFGKPGIPYTRDDLQRTLAEVSGDSAFAGAYFRQYVESGGVMDYAQLLLPAGLLLRPEQPERAWIGHPTLRIDGRGARVIQPITRGTPLYQAGVAAGDLLLSLDGHAVNAASDVEAVLAAHAPGDRVLLMFEQRGMRKTAELELAPDPTLVVVSFEAAGREVAPEVRRFRRDWLGSKAR